VNKNPALASPDSLQINDHEDSTTVAVKSVSGNPTPAYLDFSSGNTGLLTIILSDVIKNTVIQ
jgi:hypothetical protein